MNTIKHNDYEIYSYGEKFKVCLTREIYKANGRLAIQAWELPYGEPFATLTVNIDEPLSGDATTHAFVDVNNNANWGIENFLRTNGIAKPTGKFGRSGYCTYPEYEFDLSKL